MPNPSGCKAIPEPDSNAPDPRSGQSWKRRRRQRPASWLVCGPKALRHEFRQSLPTMATSGTSGQQRALRLPESKRPDRRPEKIRCFAYTHQTRDFGGG